MFKLSLTKQIIGVIVLHTVVIGAAFFTVYIPFKEYFAYISSLFVVIIFLPIGYCFVRWLGVKKGLLILGSLFMFAILIESVALKTGFPYGRFTYTSKAGVILFNLVPVVVPFAWTTILLGCGVITKKVQKSWKKILCTALLMVVVDGVLDPLAVGLKLWFWYKPGWYYGVPLINFVGWLLSALVGVSILYFSSKEFRSPNIPQTLFFSLYITMVFWLSVAFFSTTVLPLVIGLLFLGFNYQNIRKCFKEFVYE